MKKLAAVLLTILLLVLPAAAADQLTINIMALPGTTGLTLVRVFADHPSLGRGVTASYAVVKSPDQMTAKIISGEADIAAVPTNTAAILYNKGIAIQLAAATNWGVMYVVGRDPSLSSWAGLKGREIGMTGRGATPDILFRYLCRANGVDAETDLKLHYYSSPVELTQVLMAGKVQTAALPEPWVTEARQRDPSLHVLLDYQAEWKKVEKSRSSYPQSCLVVRAALAKEYPRVVAVFLAEASASSAWVNSHPAEAGRLAEIYVQIPAAAAQAAIPRCNLRFVRAASVRDEVGLYLRKLYEFDPPSIGGRLPDERFYLAR